MSATERPRACAWSAEQMPTMPAPSTATSHCMLAPDPLVDLLDVDDDALVRALADELHFVFDFYREIYGSDFNPGNQDFCRNLHPYRGGGDVPYVKMGAERLISRRQMAV